jgi:gliding motility-associated protein GldC
MTKERESEIVLRIKLDENNVPSKIVWDAPDNEVQGKEAKAIMLSLWDPEEDNTLRIDLWTKEMVVDDMKKFIHQSILLMADTLHRSTGETAMAQTMREFGTYYAEKLKLISPKEEE